MSIVRLRLYIHGRILDEAIVDTTTPDAGDRFDAAGARQGLLAGAASQFDLPWIAEAYRPDNPEATRYLRFGSDAQRIGAHSGREMPTAPASGETDPCEEHVSVGTVIGAPPEAGPQ